MKIQLITPASARSRNGNHFTAVRSARILKQLGHRVSVEQLYDGGPCDLMIALHALRSYESIRRYRERNPKSPLVVVLTGTDLYRDIHSNPDAQRSLDMASRIIVLQKNGIAELPKHLRCKARVIYQSAVPVHGTAADPQKIFKVCVVGHMRPEKDPFRTAMAARQLPRSSRVRVIHIGRPLSKEMGRRVEVEATRNPRYRWLGDLPHGKTRRVLAGSHVLSLTSRMEGSSNAMCEALASSVPVIASKIPGLIGTLGKNYPGYFPVGDTRALTRLLVKVEADSRFFNTLKARCARLFPLVDPKREIAAWKELLLELSA
jgi:putative glycosyltransferase (TIGR04348 family)